MSLSLQWAENELGKSRPCTGGIKAALTNGSLRAAHLNKSDLNGHISEIKSSTVASQACHRISWPPGKTTKALMNFYQRRSAQSSNCLLAHSFCSVTNETIQQQICFHWSHCYIDEAMHVTASRQFDLFGKLSDAI